MKQPWILSARKNWLNHRHVWASVLYTHAHSEAMSRSELRRFSLIQNWLNTNALEAKSAMRDALLNPANDSLIGEFGKTFAEDVDWSENASPKALLYGSCVQGTAQRGGDVDFAICFPRRKDHANNSEPSITRSSFSHHQHPDGAELIEPPRLLQRTMILPTFFKQVGETFPATTGLTTEPQLLHVDRVYHARVPILHFVPKHSIFPLTAKLPTFYPPPIGNAGNSSSTSSNNTNNNSRIIFKESEHNRTLPRFDVAACSSGCRNSFVLRYYFAQSVTLRVLLLVLKRWAKHRAYVVLQSSSAKQRRSSLNSYSLAIMLVYWAQQRGIVKILEKEDPSWSFVDSSPLVNGERAFLPLKHHQSRQEEDEANFDKQGIQNQNDDDDFAVEYLEENINRDQGLNSADECIAAHLFDFFAFYAEEFDRDTQVVDIRGSAAVGKVTLRTEWKDKVNTDFGNRDLRIFGIDTDDHGRAVPVSQNEQQKTHKKTHMNRKNGSTHNNGGVDEEFEIVTRHLYGHDVIAVRDPVEPHSVTRNLDFFMCEALWEELRLALSCGEPSELLGLGRNT